MVMVLTFGWAAYQTKCQTTCSRYARDVPTLIVGTLINARSVAKALTHILNTTDHTISLLSCSERWPDPDEDGPLRWALEDDLGVGAILSYLSCDKSPEARACEGIFLHLSDELSTSLINCPSGRELCDRGFSGDVDHAAHLNWCDTVPVMQEERLEKLVI
jgi:2-phosphosulfolactate phosphatase